MDQTKATQLCALCVVTRQIEKFNGPMYSATASRISGLWCRYGAIFVSGHVGVSYDCLCYERLASCRTDPCGHEVGPARSMSVSPSARFIVGQRFGKSIRRPGALSASAAISAAELQRAQAACGLGLTHDGESPIALPRWMQSRCSRQLSLPQRTRPRWPRWLRHRHGAGVG